MRISKADELLLSLLREDARASTAEIARRLGLSRTTVQNRITRLEQEYGEWLPGFERHCHDGLEKMRRRADENRKRALTAAPGLGFILETHAHDPHPY